MPFNPINKAPGVYLEEVQVPGPIAGVGTSTAAFIGPAEKGPLNKPTFLTNLTQFQNAFGGYIMAPMVYVTHAVRGFFDNGGTSCYFVRVGTAARASRTLNDRATPTARPALVVTAKQEGVAGNAITVEVQDASIVGTVAAVKAQATLSAASNKQATVTVANDAAKFRPGDIVFLEQGGTKERATIASISGTTITFQPNLTNTYTGGTIRIADLIPTQTKIRIGNTTGFGPGTQLTITQDTTTELRVVQSVDPVNNFITLTQGLTNTYTMATTDASVNLQPIAVRAQASLTAASNNQATVSAATDAANFRPGDIVFLEQGTTNERPTIASISGTTITFQTNLSNTYTGGTIRIADFIPGQRTIRVGNTIGIEPGTYLRIIQGTTAESGVVQSVERVNHFVTLTSGLTNTFTMTAAANPVTLQTLEFKLIILGSEELINLSMDPRHSRYFAKVVDSINAVDPTKVNVDITLADPPTPTLPPNNRPAVLAASVLTGGQDDDVTQIQETHYSGAIATLEKVDDVNLLCIPDCVDKSFQQSLQAKMVAHCEKMQDRFAILDPLPKATPSNGLLTQRNNLSSDSGYAALYYPWIVIANPVAAGRIKVPPSGHVAGVFARTDGTRGVHKAPANEPIRGVLELERTLTDDEQGPVNESGVNVLRFFPGSGFRVWGARTIAPKDRTQWRYVNVRRLMLFIEESIQEGTQFAVFEPNELGLWEKVKRQVTDFLTRVWRDGALFGASPEEAFRVRVDEELNPPSVRALGQLIIEVVVFPTTPAEFIVFRIIQEPGGPTIQE